MIHRFAPIPHLGCNLLFLEEVLTGLTDAGIGEPLLFRASELDKLERVLEHGTDRAGYPERRLWRHGLLEGLPVLHEDVILATTEADIRRGERDPDYSSSFKKFDPARPPLLLIYDARAFVPVREKEYLFRAPGRKLEALRAVIPVELQPGIPGGFAGGAMTSPVSPAPVFVATGASACGKTTTLQWLHAQHGLSIHAEAHPQVVASLGEQARGHLPGQPLSRVADPAHFCPVCRPREFCERVIALQHRIELAARPGDVLERGVIDPIEFYLRHSGAPAEALEPDRPGAEVGLDWAPGWGPVARYVRVFLFEVMPALQRPKWGRSAEERVKEALHIQSRLERMYQARGYEVVRVPGGTVEMRGRWVLERMEG